MPGRVGPGAAAGGYPLSVQEHFRLPGLPGEDYVVLLCPLSGDAQGLTVETLREDRPGLRMYAVRRGDGARILLLVNGSEEAAEFVCPADEGLRELLRGASHTPDPNGECRLRVGAGRMTLLA